jgi:hypothetical protein
MGISHDAKRLLGTSSLVLILLLFLVRSLPFPYPGSQPSASPHIRYAPSLIFNDNVSFTVPTPTATFNLTLIQLHSYMWKFNVTAGSVKINLTDPMTGGILWTIGPRSSGQWHLNGTGFASFNWTAPASTNYSMVLDNLNFSPSSWPLSWLLGSGSPYFSCDIHVWDLDTPAPPPVIIW